MAPLAEIAPLQQGSCFWREWAGDSERNDSIPHLRVLSLNILADGLCGGGATSVATSLDPALFANSEREAGNALLDEAAQDQGQSFTFRCPSDALEWERRWPMLLSLILEHEPDVIGLQEVDLAPGDRQKPNPAHDAEILDDFSKAGYSGGFARKKGRACDGVAIFWRSSRLKVASPSATLSLGSVFVALAQPLILDNKWRFTAVATHLKAGLAKEAETMRTNQVESLLWQLWGHENVVLLADLNAHCRQWWDDKKSAVQPRAYPTLSKELWSAYKAVLGDEPNFTSWGGWADRDVRGVFDYIFFRGDIFSPVSVLGTPSGADVLAIPERMPNPEHPTDHLPMVADFRIGGTNIKRQRRW